MGAPLCRAGIRRPRLRADGRIRRLVAGVELLIVHAGAGSVIHAIRAGKVPVVMPRRKALGEHMDDHQAEFAAALEQTGHVVVAHDAAGLAAAIERALALQCEVRSWPRTNELVRRVAERWSYAGGGRETQLVKATHFRGCIDGDGGSRAFVGSGIEYRLVLDSIPGWGAAERCRVDKLAQSVLTEVIKVACYTVRY
jgi:UDP-N-acetylglucosamine transferase subunit ALG13